MWVLRADWVVAVGILVVSATAGCNSSTRSEQDASSSPVDSGAGTDVSLSTRDTNSSTDAAALKSLDSRPLRDGAIVTTDTKRLDAFSTNPGQPGMFCEEKATRECVKVASICAVDHLTCFLGRSRFCRGWAETQESSIRRFREINQEPCFARIERTLSKSQVASRDWMDMEDICNRIWEGDGTPDSASACTSKYDCLKPYICDQELCVKHAVKGLDSFCGAPGEVCQISQYCKGSAGFGQCTDRPARDESCDAKTPCLDEFRCVAEGLCREKLTLNAACKQHDECQSGLCGPFDDRCHSHVQFIANSPTCLGFLFGKDRVPAKLLINPTPFDFGPVVVGATSPLRIFQVVNTATGPSGPLQVTLEGSGADSFTVPPTSRCRSRQLYPGGTCQIMVTFSPKVAGPTNAVLRVVGTTSEPIEGHLLGTGVISQ